MDVIIMNDIMFMLEGRIFLVGVDEVFYEFVYA